MLCIIDEFSRESLAIRVARKLKATDVIEALRELFVSRGIPAHIRSDNGPEFVARHFGIRVLRSKSPKAPPALLSLAPHHMNKQTWSYRIRPSVKREVGL